MKNQKAKRIFASICLSTCLLTCAAPIALASETTSNADSPIAPCNTYISYSACSLKVSGNTLTAYGMVNANTSVNKCSIKLVLQKKSGTSWTQVAEWSGSKNSNSYTLSQKRNSSKGTYRAVATVKVWNGNSSESNTVYSNTCTIK
ncbi:hypothetical protein [Butyricicoccus sp.]|uniref:hypothetical protein n=1 Tax=Butyricicoccus sp. TaxID=2049021 RepID=UPI003D7D9D8E